MSKNYSFIIQGGGVFSRLLQCAIEPLANIDFDNIYLTAQELAAVPDNEYTLNLFATQFAELKNYGIDRPYDRIFNYVLDQTSDYTYLSQGVLPAGTIYTKDNKIERSINYKRYKEIASRLHFKNELWNQADKIFQQTDPREVLAVHLRIKDIAGHQIDDFQFEDYIQVIDRELKNYNYQKIFVAADNIVSLERLRSIYGDLILAHNFERADTDQNDFSQWEILNFFKRKYWQTAVIDCFSLSKCRNLICRTSNFSNAAIVFGNYEEVHRL